MDKIARNHIENSLARARKNLANAVQDLGFQIPRAAAGIGDWHNVATTAAMAAAASGQIEAYMAALAADDATDPKE
jgi:hypothetical protein